MTFDLSLSRYPLPATLLVAFLVLLAQGARAQQPDVQVKLDLYPTGFTGLNQPNSFRWFDDLGHYSTAGLSVGFEQGFRAFVSERLETIPNNSDDEQLDEYYVEDPGIWRLGKQYLPFGRQTLIREDARAARGDTRLLFKGVPVSVAVCDNGNSGARGVAGRIGSTFGLSAAVGHDFGAEGTDLTLVRHPGDSPGSGHGYKVMVGGDVARRLGMYTFQAEFVALRSGDTALDKNMDVSDLNITLQPSRYQSITLGWSRDYSAGKNFFRAQGHVYLTRNFSLEPMLRLKDNNFYDLGVTLHVKL